MSSLQYEPFGPAREPESDPDIRPQVISENRTKLKMRMNNKEQLEIELYLLEVIMLELVSLQICLTHLLISLGKEKKLSLVISWKERDRRRWTS
ncbi:hypothetical protein MTR67_022347 [Solanum verrucosum]|uniref:Uncharacterized protein n=1 Tax=Solanum verrucosum TaxID=315347 RepID=A0AAF0QRP6_SOLVR|nr:hypothetical protein MTR67_022347 [Solanum verrucosum]